MKAGATYLVTDNQGHYLVNVMRLKMGEHIAVFNGRSGEWLAEITKLGKGKANITIREKIAEQTSEPDLWYLFAPIKKARIDYMIGKATELGVARMLPVVTKRTNLERIKQGKLIANATEAAEQCGRMSVPDIDPISSLDDVLDKWPEDRMILFCDEAGDAVQIKEITSEGDKWAILIGPEGGFNEGERQMIRAHSNTIPITLGPRILRADTAAVSAISLWQSFMGDWSS
mgnify:FL=1